MREMRTDTRQVILHTARRIVLAKGYAAVGINEVLAESGVPKGSFYHYFESKDAFGTSLMQDYFDDYFAAMDRFVSDSRQTAAEHLMQYWQYFYDTQIQDNCQGGCLIVKLGAEIADLSEAMREVTKAGTARIVARIEAMITAGLNDGSLTIEGTPAATAETLYDLWLGASVIAKIHGSPGQLDRAMSSTRHVLHI